MVDCVATFAHRHLLFWGTGHARFDAVDVAQARTDGATAVTALSAAQAMGVPSFIDHICPTRTAPEHFIDAGRFHRVAASTSLPTQPILGSLLNHQAYAAKLLRRFDEAAELVAQARRVLAADAPEVAHSYFILGTIALEKLVYEQAIHCFFAALRIRQRQGDPRYIARCHRGLGTAYFAAADYTLAIEHTEKAVALFTRLGDMSEKAVAEMNLGAMYLQTGEITKALLRFRAGEPTLRKTADKVHLAMLYNNIGYGFQIQKEWSAACNAYQQSVAYWREVGDPEGLVNVLDGLGLVYTALGQPETALQTFDAALDSLVALQNEAKFAHYYQLLTEQRQQIRHNVMRSLASSP